MKTLQVKGNGFMDQLAKNLGKKLDCSVVVGRVLAYNPVLRRKELKGYEICFAKRRIRAQDVHYCLFENGDNDTSFSSFVFRVKSAHNVKTILAGALDLINLGFIQKVEYADLLAEFERRHEREV